jgi:hypothetical protein
LSISISFLVLISNYIYPNILTIEAGKKTLKEEITKLKSLKEK